MKFVLDHYDELQDKMTTLETTFYHRLKVDVEQPLLMIFPGGAYQHLNAKKEGKDIAEWAENHGFHTAVVAYATTQHSPEQYVAELQDMMRFLNAHKYISKIFAIGFSSGSHITGLLTSVTPIPLSGVAFSYPVVTLSKKYAHLLTGKNFLGDTYCQENLEKYSLEKLLPQAKTLPPAFVWQTLDDHAVSVENTMLLVDTYQKLHGSIECHLFPRGDHGLAMTKKEPHTNEWVNLFDEWLIQQVQK